MAQIWIHGKPVVVESADELLKLLKYADTAPPLPRMSPPQQPPRTPAPEPEVGLFEPPRATTTPPPPTINAVALEGLYSRLDDAAKGTLRSLATAYPSEVPAPTLRDLAGLDERGLAGVMSSITKRSGGKGLAVISAYDRDGLKRNYRYRLSDDMKFVADKEGWGRGGKVMVTKKT